MVDQYGCQIMPQPAVVVIANGRRFAPIKAQTRTFSSCFQFEGLRVMTSEPVAKGLAADVAFSDKATATSARPR